MNARLDQPELAFCLRCRVYCISVHIVATFGPRGSSGLLSSSGRGPVSGMHSVSALS
jgi:hypothetical protein